MLNHVVSYADESTASSFK